MAGKKFYAVVRGRVPGIYDNWPVAKAQVDGFAGARFKGFPSRAEAAAWLAGGGDVPHRAGSSRPRPLRQSPAPEDLPSREDCVLIYTDGGAIGNPGPGAYGIVELYQGKRRELSGGFRLTTNNRMELMACIVALRELTVRNRPVLLHTDSSYVVNGISKGWAASWRKRGWRKADGQPAMNADLWEQLLDLVQGLDVRFQWLRGHAGNPLNERCDALVGVAARQKGLAVDLVYEKQQEKNEQQRG